MQFGDLFGQAEQLWHAAERLGGKIQIQTRCNHANALVSELHACLGQCVIKELNFINGNDRDGSRLAAEVIQYFGAVCNSDGRQSIGVVRSHSAFVVAGVRGGFENYSRLMRNLSAPYASKQFFGFPRKHRAANDFDAAFSEAGMLQRRMFFVWDHHDSARNYFRHYFATSWSACNFFK
jgi:hypothetical protein